MIKLRRVYEVPTEDDGFRILIDRLWPRGLSKARAGIDLWMKDISPSDELRKRFHHEAGQWSQFKDSYFRELDKKQELVRVIVDKSEKGLVTLLYAARNEELNNGAALLEYIEAVTRK